MAEDPHQPTTEASNTEGADLNFTKEEVELAAKRCNFKKGIGCDGFDGQILGRNAALD